MVKEMRRRPKCVWRSLGYQGRYIVSLGRGFFESLWFLCQLQFDFIKWLLCGGLAFFVGFFASFLGV
jgi:hypothetical protein